MAQITTGLRALLSNAGAYNLFQNLVGARRYRKKITSEYILPRNPVRLLDIGCGTAEILHELPESIDYTGFDASETYIAQARTTFGARGHFFAELVSEANLKEMPPFDIVLATGLLHHLDDGDAQHLFALAARALKPGGILITADPCFEPMQNPLARFVIRRDRGRNVRTTDNYRKLATGSFGHIDAITRRDLLHIPYSHTLLLCSEPVASPTTVNTVNDS